MSRRAARITKAELIALSPCNLSERLALFGDKKSLSVAEALEAGATIKDILWVAGRLDTAIECVNFAIGCARLVAHHNPDPRVIAAIEAAEKANAADAANAAYAAAYAAYAANAANAANADYAAAYAANAANAAAYAAYAAAYAAYAAEADIKRLLVAAFS